MTGACVTGNRMDQTQRRQRAESREIDYRRTQSRDVDIVRRKVYHNRLSSKILNELRFGHARKALVSGMAAGVGMGNFGFTTYIRTGLSEDQ